MAHVPTMVERQCVGKRVTAFVVSRISFSLDCFIRRTQSKNLP